MRRTALLLGSLVIALTIGTAPAFAKKKPRKASSAQRKADKAKKRAFKLFRKGDFNEGIAAMETAYRLVEHPGFLLNIAVAYDQWGGHCADSLAAFDRFFEKCAGTCRIIGAATARHAKVQAACQGELAVITNPSGAEVEVDGKVVGTSPFTAPVGLGRHFVAIRLDGHRAETEEIRVTEGKTTRLDILLTADAASPPPPPDLSPPPPPPPNGNGGGVIVQPPPTEGGSPWPWVAMGVGAAGVGVGVVFTLQTLSTLDAEEAARRERNTKGEVTRLQRDARSKAVVANIGYAVGIVGLATGALLLILDSDDEPDAMTIGPAIGPSNVGIAGTF